MRHFGLILCSNLMMYSNSQESFHTQQLSSLSPKTISTSSSTSSPLDLVTTNLDHQFQIRSSLDSSLCLTRSEQQKLTLENCDLKRKTQWFKHSKNSGLISNENSCLKFDNCDSSNSNKTHNSNSNGLLNFIACNVQARTQQSFEFIGNKIRLADSSLCSINIDQHDEFRRVYAIPDQFDRGLPQLIQHALGKSPSLIESLLNHGCWCKSLNNAQKRSGSGSQDQNLRYSQSMVPIDGLDTICRDWMNTRKCILYKGGACFRQPRDGRYLMTEDLRCLDEQHIIPNSTSVNCLNDTCRIDKFYVDKIRDFFKEEESSWKQVKIDDGQHNDFCLPEEEGNLNLNGNQANGLFGNRKKKYSRPRVRICTGKAPNLVLESIEPPKPKKMIPPFPKL